ncbi:MAG TPA: hypothetical protein VF476_08550 [Chitinophagaceae bacterium]
MKKKKSFLLILLVAISVSAWSQKQIRYDGYYHTLSDSLNPFRFYLRFYDDGTVISYCTAGKPETLLKWFSKNDNSSLKGKYVLKDSVLHFSVKGTDGEIVYDGSIIGGSRLWMTVTSLINKYSGKEEYFFQEAKGMK